MGRPREFLKKNSSKSHIISTLYQASRNHIVRSTFWKVQRKRRTCQKNLTRPLFVWSASCRYVQSAFILLFCNLPGIHHTVVLHDSDDVDSLCQAFGVYLCSSVGTGCCRANAHAAVIREEHTSFAACQQMVGVNGMECRLVYAVVTGNSSELPWSFHVCPLS